MMKNKIFIILVMTLLITCTLVTLGDKTNIENTIKEENKSNFETSNTVQRGLFPNLPRILNKDWNYWANKPNLFTIPTGNVGIGTDNPSEKLEVVGTIHSTEGGFKFPDGTVQKTAATCSGYSAIAFGTIDSDGNILSGTPNVGCYYWGDVEPEYEISISGESYYLYEYSTVITPFGGSYITLPTTSSYEGNLLVSFYDLSGNWVKSPNGFSFVIYKYDDIDAYSFAAKVVGSNLKITYATGPEDISIYDITIIIDTGYSLALGINGTGDLDSDGKWDPGDYVTQPTTNIDNNPCPVTVVVKGATILDTEVNI